MKPGCLRVEACESGDDLTFREVKKLIERLIGYMHACLTSTAKCSLQTE